MPSRKRFRLPEVNGFLEDLNLFGRVGVLETIVDDLGTQVDKLIVKVDDMSRIFYISQVPVWAMLALMVSSGR